MRATVISIQDNGGYDRRFETLTMNDELNVVLSLGSNCGDRESAVAEAAGWLSRMLDGFLALIYMRQGQSAMTALII